MIDDYFYQTDDIPPIDVEQMRDLLENPTTVQMEHRIITHLTFLSLMSVCYVGFKCK